MAHHQACAGPTVESAVEVNTINAGSHITVSPLLCLATYHEFMSTIIRYVQTNTSRQAL